MLDSSFDNADKSKINAAELEEFLTVEKQRAQLNAQVILKPVSLT